MIRYITRRLLLFIPTLVIISLLAFIISVNAPGDPVERMMSSSSTEGPGTQSISQRAQREFWRKKLGLDLPVFYFSIHPISLSRHKNKFPDTRQQEAFNRMVYEYGNDKLILDYFSSIKKLKFITDSCRAEKACEKITSITSLLQGTSNTVIIKDLLAQINLVINNNPGLLSLQDYSNELSDNFNRLLREPKKWKNYIPVIDFHSNNQYHRWLFGDGNWITGEGAVYTKGVIRGDFGMSYQTRQPVSAVINEKIGWSLFFSLLSVLLAYLISIPVGIKAGAHKGSLFDRTSSLVLFLLYSMPSFWVATLLLMTFANPDILHWFPASGVKPATGYPANALLIDKLKLSLPYLILPAICYTYGSFAFLSRTMRVAIIESMSEDYIRTASAKGLPYSKVVTRHAFRNSLLPLITVFANVFPMIIGGSVILETIFSIPGMGYETVQSIQNQNYPMIVAVFTITGFLTMTGYLLSDILYALADPRITFKSRSR